MNQGSSAPLSKKTTLIEDTYYFDTDFNKKLLIEPFFFLQFHMSQIVSTVFSTI